MSLTDKDLSKIETLLDRKLDAKFQEQTSTIVAHTEAVREHLSVQMEDSFTHLGRQLQKVTRS